MYRLHSRLRLFQGFVALAVLLSSLCLATRPARAAGVVGNGAPGSCTESALNTALASGGTITFNCGPAPHTIVLTGQKTVSADTVVDGGGLVSLSGNSAARLFVVDAGVTLQLDNITLSDGNAGQGYGGCLLNNRGTATLNNVVVERCVTGPDYAGGGIYNDNGTLTLNNSLVRANRSPYGGGIDSVGTLTLVNTVVTGNAATVGLGGALDVGGTITVADSVIEGNRAMAGGGINITTAGDVKITDSQISDNGATGARAIPAHGGGILNAGRLSLLRVRIGGNAAVQGGGIYHSAPHGALELRDSTVDGNTATEHGGGLFGFSGPAQLSNATFSANRAGQGGGGIYAYGDRLTIAHGTFSGNQAVYAGAIYRDDAQGATVELARTVLADNDTGNCGGAIESAGYNLADDTYCGLETASDRQNVDPKLGALLANGGKTFTHAPAADSAAVDFAPVQGCPPADQRGVARPKGGGCDAGAVELDVSTPVLGCGGNFDALSDTTISASAPATSLGSDDRLRVGRSGQGEERALLDFDIGKSLPRGATIYSAQLELGLYQAPASLPYALEVREISAAWNEASTTWQAAPVLGASYGPGFYKARDVVRIDVTALVIRWTTEQLSEHGLALLPGADAIPQLRFFSREAADQAAVRPRLVVRCMAPMAAPPPDVVADNQAQAADAARLKAASSVETELQFGAGSVRFADFKLQPPAAVGSDPLAIAQWFVNDYRSLLRLDNPQVELQLFRRSSDGLSQFFRQLHQAIPVVGAELKVELDATGVVGIGGNYVPDISLSPNPGLPAELAEALALASAGTGASLLGDTQLRYVNPGLLGNSDHQTHLAWEVSVDGPADQLTLLIDANSGALLLSLPRRTESFDLDLEDGNNNTPSDLCSIWEDDDIDPGDQPPDSVNAANGYAAAHNYWQSQFGRDSYDGDGEQIEVNVYANFPNNASYQGCDIFVFGNGMPVLDVVGHEFTHAVDASAANLAYMNESGALDESFADIFGHFLDNDDWQIGEGSAAGVRRDMSNPPAFGQPDHMVAGSSGDGIGLRTLPAGQAPECDIRKPTFNDCGNVHTNSGIQNKAAFLIVQGGTHNGFRVNGIGQFKAERMFYYVLTDHLWSSAQLIDARNQVVAEAQRLAAANRHGFTGQDVCSVRNAYAAVGLGSGDRNCDGEEDAVDPDIDGDWKPNAQDNCPNLFNPAQDNVDGDAQGDDCDPDIDGDGRPNTADNCKLVANPGWPDWNSDNEGDHCDDSDGDGTFDNVDNCRNVFNNQRDQDADGVGDACDPDLDGDGRLNVADNCPLASNPGQEDSTEAARGLARDGIGDACDLCPEVSSTDNVDLDGDGLANPCDDDDDGDRVLDTVDNCPVDANTTQWDWDRNGIGYVCDTAEREAFGAIWNSINDRYVRMERVTHIPIPVCPTCSGSFLPDRYQTVINVALPINFKARVVDSAGRVVAKGTAGAGGTRLSFRPAAYAAQQRAVASSAGPPVEPPPKQTAYYLELVPQPGVDLSTTYPLTLQLTEVKGNLYLPIAQTR